MIDVFPVTCGQYEEFIKDGGYEDYKYWLADGWSKVNENKWECPMYWTRSDGEWFVHDFAGMRPIDPKEPVCNVSYYEASAYCKWAGKRLLHYAPCDTDRLQYGLFFEHPLAWI